MRTHHYRMIFAALVLIGPGGSMLAQTLPISPASMLSGSSFAFRITREVTRRKCGARGWDFQPSCAEGGGGDEDGGFTNPVYSSRTRFEVTRRSKVMACPAKGVTSVKTCAT